MTGATYKIQAKVRLWPGLAAWHMVTLPKGQSEKIRNVFGDLHRGWSSLPVVATLGQTTWKTSIFWDRKSDAYVLPLKLEVRKREHVTNGQKINFAIEIKV